MKKILVPTDFSETANTARDYAVQLAQAFNAEVILLNAFHVPYTGGGSGTFVNLDKLAKVESERQIKQQLSYLKLNYSNIKFSSVCVADLVVDAIKTICNKSNIDLVVMGTIGETDLIDKFLGSKTSSIIGEIKTPILAIPSNTTINFPKHIVVANDLMVSGEDKLFTPLKEILAITKSSLDFVFVVDEEHLVENKMQRLKAANFDSTFDASYHPFHFRHNEDVEEGILEYIDKKKVDLLVVVSHQRTFWQKFFHKNIAKSLTKQTKLPILILSE